MKNNNKTNSLKSEIKQTSFGILTTLITDIEISAKDSISCNGKTLLANYVSKKNSKYNLVYTIVDSEGNSESFIEDEGILPTLFLSPNKENYVSVVPYNPDKELEISIPVFNRENTELPIGNRPFTGRFIGTSNQFSIFHEVDVFSDIKPDKLVAIEFKNDVIKKKHNIKVALPRNNNIFISNNEIHLLAHDGSRWLHRQINEKGEEIKNRKLDTKQEDYLQILSLSFCQNSYLLAQKEGNVIIEKITIDGNVEVVELIDITDPFFNTWQPVEIAENTYVTRFNNEFGNGWFTIKDDQLLEFFYSKKEKGYKNLLTNDFLQMDSDNLIISSITKTTENCYAIVFYPMTEQHTKNNKLIILNHKIKEQ
ncbi:MAG: hypothetical protein IPO21_15725 [Bacteroidales bacterium]|nr:hypothetical protein [Bacteroidales bacterium]